VKENHYKNFSNPISVGLIISAKKDINSCCQENTQTKQHRICPDNCIKMIFETCLESFRKIEKWQTNIG
jgi:hypothetical protein